MCDALLYAAGLFPVCTIFKKSISTWLIVGGGTIILTRSLS